jgi:hypothetical protein
VHSKVEEESVHARLLLLWFNLCLSAIASTIATSHTSFAAAAIPADAHFASSRSPLRFLSLQYSCLRFPWCLAAGTYLQPRKIGGFVNISVTWSADDCHSVVFELLDWTLQDVPKEA